MWIAIIFMCKEDTHFSEILAMVFDYDVIWIHCERLNFHVVKGYNVTCTGSKLECVWSAKIVKKCQLNETHWKSSKSVFGQPFNGT